MMSTDEIDAWLSAWAQAIRDNDLEAGRRMFAENVVGFGTLTGAMIGLDALVSDQWSQIWPRTAGFVFGPVHQVSVTDDLAVVVAEWRSEGRTDAGAYERRGRATLVLRPTASGLVCTHSHFSMFPGTPALR